MNLSDIAISICMDMRTAKAKQRKCTISFTTFDDCTQSVNFTPFWIRSGVGVNKDFSFYDFQTDNEHKEKLKKVKQYLQGQINEDQLFNN
jgi:hypothetical protein